MKKKVIAQLRKEFKDGSTKLNLKELYSVYLKKDDGSVLHSKLEYMENIGIEKRELYYNNFKKVLSSAIDTKFFELNFDKITEGNTAQSLLVNSLNSADKQLLQNNLDRIIERILLNCKFESDVVVNFIRGEYYKGNRRRNVEADEAEDDTVSAFEFLICSINKVEVPKKMLVFDYLSKDFEPSSSIEVIVNLNSPLDGFMFPSLEDDYINVNKLMYYCSKSKEFNIRLVEDVLDCTAKPTADDEREYFHSILASVVGEKIKTEVIQNIYTSINEKASQDEDVDTIGLTDMKKILAESGISAPEQLKDAFEQICGGDYDFKIDNIIPDFKSKSIKITNEIADISITPKNLSGVKQVIDQNGKKCILIEIDDDTVINGLTLETENSGK